MATDTLPAGPREPGWLQTVRYIVDPYGLFRSAHRRFGDVVTVRIMGETWVVLAHPDAVREVFARGPEEVDSGVANRSLRPLLGTRNVLLLDGQEHLRRRKVVLPPFHGERMRAYEALMREATRRELGAWPVGVPVPVLPHMQAITFRVVLRAVFGMTDGARLERVGAMLRRFMAWSVDPRRGLVFTFLGPERLMALPAYRRQRDELDRELLAEIAARREVADLAERADILSLLLRATHEDGSGLSDGELRDELVTLLLAGHETTAAALSWALVELARHPEVQGRIAAGEDGVAEAAVAETLRLHPPLPVGAVRRLRHDMTVADRHLPAGTTVVLCTTLAHRRPEVYDDPTAWRVDRFLGRRPPAGAWLPFGGGVRRCVGAAFAQFEAATVLDELIRARELRPAGRPTTRISRRGIVLVPPRGGRVVTSRRPATARSGERVPAGTAGAAA